VRKVEALHAGAATPGERDAAAAARERIRARLRELERTSPPVEWRFSMADAWSRQLLVALLRRYGLRPYRWRGQRYTTVMVHVTKRFVDETLWPEYLELSRVLRHHLADVTDRLIRGAIHESTAEAEEIAHPLHLEDGGRGAEYRT